MRVFWLSAAAVSVLCCASVVQAETGGSVTTLLWQGENSLHQQRGNLLQRLRFQWQQQIGMLDWRVDDDVLALYGGMVRDPLFARQKRHPPATWLDAESVLYDRSPWWLRHRLYRGWLRWQQGDWQLVAGRQRMAWGTGRFWNPTDIFNPVSPVALEPEEKTGADALSLQWNYSGFGSLQAVLAPGKHRWGLPRKQAVRWRDTFDIGDISVSWLRADHQNLLGVDYAGDLGDAGIRFEGVRSSDGRWQQWLVGGDVNYVSRCFPAGLYVALEYLNNKAANPSYQPLSAMPSAMLQSRSHQLLAGRAAYDVTALWHVELNWIQDLEHASQAVLPGVQYSPGEDMEVQWTLQWMTGQQGEFAGLNTISLLRWQWFF